MGGNRYGRRNAANLMAVALWAANKMALKLALEVIRTAKPALKFVFVGTAKVVDDHVFSLGARDGNRTRTAIACRFSSHNVFRRRQLAVRAPDYAFALVLSHVRRPPSSLYTFPFFVRDLARYRRVLTELAFTEFDQFYPLPAGRWRRATREVISVSDDTQNDPP